MKNLNLGNFKNFTNHLWLLKFRARDKFIELKKLFFFVFCCICFCKDKWDKNQKYFLTKTQSIFIKGQKRAQKNLDFVHMVQTIEKLKAGVSALVQIQKNEKKEVDISA